MKSWIEKKSRKYHKEDIQINISKYLEIYRGYIDILDSYGSVRLYKLENDRVRLNSFNYVIDVPKGKLLDKLDQLGLYYVLYDDFIIVSYRKKDQI